MAHEIIRNSIIGTIESLVEMAATVTTTQEHIHQIDIDLLLEQIRKLYREVQMLDEANKTQWVQPSVQQMSNTLLQPQEHLIQVKPAENEPPVIEPSAELPVIESTEDTPLPNDPDTIAVDEHADETIDQTVHEVIEENNSKPFVSENEPESQEPPVSIPPVVESVPTPITLAEKLQKDDKSLNEQMRERSQGLNQRLNESPVTNLKTAIGINDKFMFVNELFKGEMKAYDQLIGDANQAENLTLALRMLHDKLLAYGTHEKAEVIKKLENFFYRRFSS